MKGSILHFAVLIPHRDTQQKLRIISQGLLEAGFTGARALPPVAPLALLKKPLSEHEWKKAAEHMRSQSLGNDSKGYIHATGPEKTCFGKELSALSLKLDIPGPGFPEQTIIEHYSPALWLAAEKENVEYVGETIAIQFRTAALGELSLKPLDSLPGSCSFRWSMRIKAWLPKPERT